MDAVRHHFSMCVCVCVVSSRWRGLQGDGPDGAGVLLAEHEGGGHTAGPAVSQPATALHPGALTHTAGAHHQSTGEAECLTVHQAPG